MTREASSLKTVVGELSFTEGPRWHEGRLWFSDAHAGRVLSVDEAGDHRVEAVMPGSCSGLGWRPDGTLLVLLTQARKLVAVIDEQIVEVADLTALAPGSGTEMITDLSGRAYIGNTGFDFRANEPPRPADLIAVDLGGHVSIAASGLEFPNGTVITADGKTLIIAETMGKRVTAFDIAADGSLSNRRLFANLGDVMPDGMCLDAEGAIWVASPNTCQVLRVREGGEIVERVSTGERGAYACMLGGADRKILYIASGSRFDFGKSYPKQPGALDAVRVAIPGSGVP